MHALLRALVVCLFFGGCTCESDEAAPPVPALAADPVESLYAIDALFLPSLELSVSPDRERLADALERLLEGLHDTGVDALPARRRLILQNDVWGLHFRAQQMISDPVLDRISHASARLAHALALDDLGAWTAQAQLPAEVRQAAPNVHEHGSEMPVLSHESSFGFRRVFRVALSPDLSERVLFSQLIAFDRQGDFAVTRVVGEIEHLRFADGAVAEARVWHLTHDDDPQLHEETSVENIPSLGADSFFIREQPAVLLADLPCARCHEDDDTHSLPRADLDAQARWPALLRLAKGTLPSVGE